LKGATKAITETTKGNQVYPKLNNILKELNKDTDASITFSFFNRENSKSILESISKEENNYRVITTRYNVLINEDLEIIATTNKENGKTFTYPTDKIGDSTIEINSRLMKPTFISESSEEIISTRIANTNEHFGNPFSHDPAGKTQGLIKTDTIKKAVENYIDWIIYGNEAFAPYNNQVDDLKLDLDKLEERRLWILQQLKDGRFKDTTILYYKELGEPSHATALDYLINKYDWNTQQQATVSEQTTTGLSFDTLTEFNNIEKERILTNFADKYYKGDKAKALQHINASLPVKGRGIVVEKLRECYN